MTVLKPIPDTFIAAASGDAQAQEEMCSAILRGYETLETAPDAVLLLAYNWASMAYVNGSRAIRSRRAVLLVALAARSAAASEPPEVARGFLGDALGHLYELEREGDEHATPYIAAVLAAIAADPAFGDVPSLIERGRELASRRERTATALVSMATRVTPGVASTVH